MKYYVIFSRFSRQSQSNAFDIVPKANQMSLPMGINQSHGFAYGNKPIGRVCQWLSHQNSKSKEKTKPKNTFSNVKMSWLTVLLVCVSSFNYNWNFSHDIITLKSSPETLVFCPLESTGHDHSAAVLRNDCGLSFNESSFFLHFLVENTL